MVGECESMLRTQVSVLLGLASLGMAGTAAAGTTLDQFQLDGTEQNQAIHSTRAVGQTFTVGIAGTLDSIELSLFESGAGGDLVLEILDFSGGDIATSPTLGSVSIDETELGPAPTVLSLGSVTATLIDISSLGIKVNVGDLLAFRLSSERVLDPPTNIYGIRTAVFSDLYAGGAYFVGTEFTRGDAAFKITVDTTREIDHFKCYLARGERFRSERVFLEDRFGARNSEVRGPVSFCNPVDKNGEGINDPDARLVCYRIVTGKGDSDFGARELPVENQFGEDTIRIGRAQTLCVPSTEIEFEDSDADDSDGAR